MYGPDGTNEVMVLMVEADPSTALDCLYDDPSCFNTLGDWTEGISFPIINNNTIGDLYDISYFPTIYHICPNRIVREAGQSSADQFYALNSDCQMVTGVNNAAILQYKGFEGSFCGSITFTPSITFQNLGTGDLTSATFELSVNGSLSETIEWTGSLTTYQYEDITFSEVTATEETMVEIKVTQANGAADEDTSNDVITAAITLAPMANYSHLTLKLRTDSYPDETSWQVKNAAGMTIAMGGNYSSTNTVYTEEIAVPANDCYEFIITDTYGDGICCSYGPGYYQLLDPDGNVLFEGGEFESEYIEPFEVEGATASKELEAVSELNVFPNPVGTQLNIGFNLTQTMPLDVAIYNTLGQEVQTVSNQQFAAGNHTLNVATDKLTNGVYFVRFANGEKQVSTKFTVLK